jgi:glycosyltransferase involved in cell wall biosynthesis
MMKRPARGSGGGSRKRVCYHGLTFSGMILGSETTAALAASEVFVLPSYSEHFGVAAVEAYASGPPFLISNRVNIWREVAREQCGES